jgi:uncharacterized protein with von Willebrand factor type A (vWA) domain
VLPAPDAAALAAGLGAALHAAGLPVGPDRCERLARAVTVMPVRSLADLHACALATLVSDPGQVATFERVFAALFGTPAPPAPPGAVPQPPGPRRPADPGGQRADGDGRARPPEPGRWLATADGTRPAPAADGDEPLREVPALRQVASAAERLRGRDFTELSAAELRQLVTLMREMTMAVPPRRTRRYRDARNGRRPDLRGTLRRARRSGGEAIRIARRAPRTRPRRLVVLCDISGSMEPYARALLMLLYCLSGGPSRGGPRPEVFSFATRLTRLTPALAAASPDTMLAKAGEAAPDWSGGTRIGPRRGRADHLRRLGDRRPGAARRADGQAVPRRAPDRVGQSAHPVPAVQPRGRRDGRRLAVLRRRGERAQHRRARRPAGRPRRGGRLTGRGAAARTRRRPAGTRGAAGQGRPGGRWEAVRASSGTNRAASTVPTPATALYPCRALKPCTV